MYRIVGKKYRDLYQWDKGVRLKFDDDLENAEIHFADNKETAIRVDINEQQVIIPDELLQSGRPLDVYIYKLVNNQYYTTQWFTIPVIRRPRPENY